MPLTQTTILLLAVCLIVFFILHSFLASVFVKQKLERRSPFFVRYYRLFYNLLAVILFLPFVFILRFYSGSVLWSWSPPYSLIADGIAISAIVAFMWTLKGYDMLEFLGIRQVFMKDVSVYDQGAMHISTLHRFVRHPWYTLILIILWTRNIHVAHFVIYSLASVYFFIGSRLEEKKLLVYYGDAYKQYMQKVPSLIPIPGRYINKQEAQRLIALGAGKNQSIELKM